MPALHNSTNLLKQGAPLGEAKMALILLHGRGASAQDILPLAESFKHATMAYLAPQAADNSWYPNRFMVPVAQNEPHLSSALGVVGTLIQNCIDAGIPRDKVYLMGFSQGACLALEYAARNPARYGGVFALSGGIIGSDEEERTPTTTRLDGSPVFLGCSNVDPHIPVQRVRDSAEFMKGLGGTVLMKLYPLMGHTVNDDEINSVRMMMGLEPDAVA